MGLKFVESNSAANPKVNTLPSTEFYNRLARAFDVMTDWNARLAHEMPFIQQTLDRYSAQTVLDTACGTGWHTIALAQKGYEAFGCDASPAMIERAVVNAAEAGVKVRFEVADFNQMNRFPEKFDAILCLGNSLPHLLSQEELVEALGKMRERLSSGGLVILHNLNYDLRLKKKPRFFAASGTADTLVWRFADYEKDFITFHTALFERKPGSSPSWSVEVNSTLQRPLLKEDLDSALEEVGLSHREHYGGLDGSPFHPETSGDLVIVASRI